MRIFVLSVFLVAVTYAQGACTQDPSTCLAGQFCDFDSDRNCAEGTCVDCSAINVNANTLDCINQANFECWETSAACFAVCEYQNLGNAPYSGSGVNVPTSFVPQPVPAEGQSCTGCCNDGSVFKPVCPSLLANDPCKNSFCSDEEDADGNLRCMYNIEPNGQECLIEHPDILNDKYMVLGKCLDGNCIVKEVDLSEDLTCPPGQALTVKSERLYGPCGTRTVLQDFEFTGTACPTGTSGDCDQFGYQWEDVVCWSSSFKDEPAQFSTSYHDPDEIIGEVNNVPIGRCLVGQPSDLTGVDTCVMDTPGYYQFRDMNIVYQLGSNANTQVSLMTIDYQTKTFQPKLTCLGQFCRGEINCRMTGSQPCERSYPICERPTTNSPTQDPTAPPSSSHGDPIIWTFDEECYDLSKDGLWLATSHPRYDHDVKIAVHNDYMREIQVVDNWTGEVMLAINNLGEVLNNNFPYFFSHETRECPPDMKECEFMFEEFKFDAQNFEYTVQVLLHDYLDPALKDGELGVHLDVFPKPYQAFDQYRDGYSGLYFENPLPEELEYCAGGSIQY